jgi:hypothetical protein
MNRINPSVFHEVGNRVGRVGKFSLKKITFLKIPSTILQLQAIQKKKLMCRKFLIFSFAFARPSSDSEAFL